MGKHGHLSFRASQKLLQIGIMTSNYDRPFEYELFTLNDRKQVKFHVLNCIFYKTRGMLKS